MCRGMRSKSHLHTGTKRSIIEHHGLHVYVGTRSAQHKTTGNYHNANAMYSMYICVLAIRKDAFETSVEIQPNYIQHSW